MLSFKTAVDVHNTTPQAILDFILNCTDEDYQRWWPGGTPGFSHYQTLSWRYWQPGVF